MIIGISGCSDGSVSAFDTGSCGKDNAAIIDINVAQLVAKEYLPKYYPGDWDYFSHLTYYDLDGTPAVYAFIFKKPDSDIKNLQQLEKAMSSARFDRDNLKKNMAAAEQAQDESAANKSSVLKAKLRALNGRIYQWNSFATVITGAKETSELVIRCYTGLPKAYVKKADLKSKLETEYSDKNLKLGRTIYLDPYDIRYEVKPATGLSEPSYLMDLKSMTLKEKTKTTEKIKKAAEARKGKISRMPKEKAKQHEEGLKKRKEINKLKWQKYRGKK